jgi:hypothetical protein
MNEIAAKLHQMFVLFGYKWRISGELVTPTVEDISQTLDRAKEVLYTEAVPSQLEVGRIIVQHYEQGKFNIYLHFGAIND